MCPPSPRLQTLMLGFIFISGRPVSFQPALLSAARKRHLLPQRPASSRAGGREGLCKPLSAEFRSKSEPDALWERGTFGGSRIFYLTVRAKGQGLRGLPLPAGLVLGHDAASSCPGCSVLQPVALPAAGLAELARCSGRAVRASPSRAQPHASGFRALGQPEPPFCPFLPPLQICFFFSLKLLILTKTMMKLPDLELSRASEGEEKPPGAQELGRRRARSPGRGCPWERAAHPGLTRVKSPFAPPRLPLPRLPTPRGCSPQSCVSPPGCGFAGRGCRRWGRCGGRHRSRIRPGDA